MSDYTPEQLAQKKRDIECINELSKKVPSAYPGWFYQRVVDFREALKSAVRDASNTRITPDKIRSARIRLESFYTD